MYICGIDEAGRGPVIGPMVIGAAVISMDNENLLKDLKVKDSKQLTRNQRDELYPKVKEVCETFTEILTAEMIDSARKDLINLNRLEELTMIKLIDKVKKIHKDCVFYLDCPDVNNIRFGNIIGQITNAEIIAEHKADDKYPIVSAASIIAKVDRDNEIDKIKKELNVELGSGYPSDPTTKKALEQMIKNKSKYIRYSWETTQKIISELQDKGTQKKLY